MAKLETRIRELEIELGNVQARIGENMKAHQKADRKIKELQFQTDEDKKNKIVCQSLHPSCSKRSRLTRSRLRRLRRLPLLILPNSARHNKNWRKLRTAQEWLKTPSTLLIKNQWKISIFKFCQNLTSHTYVFRNVQINP